MSFTLSKADRTLGEGFRRIATRQVDAALRAIEDRSPAEAIHRVRRNCKILRGLIRLMRTGFDGFADEDAAIRQIAKRLSDARDAKVLLDTFDMLAGKADGEVAAQAARHIHAALKSAREAERESGRGQDLLEGARHKLRDLRARGQWWTINGRGWDIVGEGAAITYGHMEKAAARAFGSGLTGDYHKLRRHVRYHWCHVRLLRPLWPDEMEARARLADDLAHALGKHHDIAVCIDRLKDDRALLCHTDEREPLLALAGRESLALEQHVHLLAGRLLAEPADAFIGHWQALWANWQASGDRPALPGENPEYQTSWASDWGSKPSS